MKFDERLWVSQQLLRMYREMQHDLEDTCVGCEFLQERGPRFICANPKNFQPWQYNRQTYKPLSTEFFPERPAWCKKEVKKGV